MFGLKNGSEADFGAVYDEINKNVFRMRMQTFITKTLVPAITFHIELKCLEIYWINYT